MYLLHHKNDGVYAKISLSVYPKVYRSPPDPGRIRMLWRTCAWTRPQLSPEVSSPLYR